MLERPECIAVTQRHLTNPVRVASATASTPYSLPDVVDHSSGRGQPTYDCCFRCYPPQTQRRRTAGTAPPSAHTRMHLAPDQSSLLHVPIGRPLCVRHRALATNGKQASVIWAGVAAAAGRGARVLSANALVSMSVPVELSRLSLSPNCERTGRCARSSRSSPSASRACDPTPGTRERWRCRTDGGASGPCLDAEGDLAEQIRRLFADATLTQARQVARLSRVTYPSKNLYPGQYVSGFAEAWNKISSQWGSHDGKAPPGLADAFHVETHVLERGDVFLSNDRSLLSMCRWLHDEYDFSIVAMKLEDFVATVDSA
jgi:hypothetical protein